MKTAFTILNLQEYSEKSSRLYAQSQDELNREGQGPFFGHLSTEVKKTVPMDILHYLCNSKNVYVVSQDSVTYDMSSCQVLDYNPTVDLFVSEAMAAKPSQYYRVNLLLKSFSSYSEFKKSFSSGDILLISSIRMFEKSIWVKYGILPKSVHVSSMKRLESKRILADKLNFEKWSDSEIVSFVESEEFRKHMRVLKGKTPRKKSAKGPGSLPLEECLPGDLDVITQIKTYSWDIEPLVNPTPPQPADPVNHSAEEEYEKRQQAKIQRDNLNRILEGLPTAGSGETFDGGEY